MKPIKLVSRALNNSTQENHITYDPFGGSGSTLIACEDLKRKCRMIEIEPTFVQTIINRWEKKTGGKAEQIG